MSTNQAFIKAYRHDSAQPQPARPTGDVTPPPSSPGRAAIPRKARAASPATADILGATVTYASPNLASDLDFDNCALTVQANSLADVGVSPYAPDITEFDDSQIDTPYTTTSERPRGPHSGKRPLSAFIKKSTEPPRSASLSLRPGTTIASLHWPAACRNLLTRHGQIFDRITETLLEQAAAGRPILGVIGLFRGIGCTTTTLCLASRAAECGRRVVIVDGHFQSPNLATCLDADPNAWWQDVLERGAALADALVRAEDDRLDLLPLNPYARAMPPALQVTATAGALRHAYELALVDLGTFFDPTSQPKALDLIRHMRIEAVVAVAGPDSCDPRDLETVAARLADCGCELLGTIDNRVVS